MIVARTREELRKGLASLSGAPPLALVPTMGALHAGHLSLIRRARERTDSVAVSIFVNPTQFGPGEDFDRYPRPLESDLERAREEGVALVFAPDSDAVIYPTGEPRVTVDPGPLGERLCGPFRPGHFRGVLTVVAKLFGLVGPELAVFGRKDFQQAVLIRRMVRDLELGVQIEVAPLVREEDGLAVSSRNVHLSAEEREDARGLHGGLRRALRLFREGERRGEVLEAAVREVAAGRTHLELQYVEVVDPDSLAALDRVREGAVVAVAGLCGSTRLIDNMVLE